MQQLIIGTISSIQNRFKLSQWAWFSANKHGVMDMEPWKAMSATQIFKYFFLKSEMHSRVGFAWAKKRFTYFPVYYYNVSTSFFEQILFLSSDLCINIFQHYRGMCFFVHGKKRIYYLLFHWNKAFSRLSWNAKCSLQLNRKNRSVGKP